MDIKFKSLHILLVATLFLTACGSDSEPDTDADTIIDTRDNCINTPNTDQLNTDGDALGDACDDDDDNDGVNDDLDAFPLDGTEQADIDNDGLGDNKDLDLDRSQHNSATIERLTEEGRAIRIIAPQIMRAGGEIGEDIVNAGDVNGDGFDDLLIGYGKYEINDIKMGICYLIFGREAGFPQDILLAKLDQTDLDYVIFKPDEGETDTLGLGVAVSALGDINGDEMDDFAISAPYMDTSLGDPSGGEAYIIFGREVWADKNITTTELKNTYAMGYKGQKKYGLLGINIINAGDLNNDTKPDIMITEYEYDIVEDEGTGIVHIIFGGDHFTPPVNNQVSMTNIDDVSNLIHTVLHGLGPYPKTGHIISAIGDFNQDQIADVALQSPEYGGSARFVNDGAGAVSIVFGRTTWPAEINLADLSGTDGFNIYGDGFGLQFGKSLAAADFNNDQVSDVIIGAPDHAVKDDINPNKVFMLWGGSGPWPASITASQIESTYGNVITSDRDIGLGISLSVLDDTNDDGQPELLIISDDYEERDSYNDPGSLFKLYSGNSWNNLELTYDALPDGIDRIGMGDSDFFTLGRCVKALGDYNQDGIQDMLYDVNYYYRDEDDVGFDTVYIIFGYQNLIQGVTVEQ